VADEPDGTHMDPSFWEQKSEEAQLVANRLRTSEAKTEMRQVASAYARLARRIQHLRQTKRTPERGSQRTSEDGRWPSRGSTLEQASRIALVPGRNPCPLRFFPRRRLPNPTRRVFHSGLKRSIRNVSIRLIHFWAHTM
jgi:hypothetical protein